MLSLPSIVEAAAAVAFVDDDVPAAEAEADVEEEALVRVRDKTGEQWDMLVVSVEGVATKLLL
jgi:hypothetical protein